MSVALLNGQPASADDLRALVLLNYGHFTSLQVRGRAAQGVELHRQRLIHGTRELFGTALDFSAARAQMRAAVAETPDCTLRVTVFSRHFDYRNPALLNGSRRARIAKGSGTTPADVNKLLKQFQQMEKMMGKLAGGGMKGMMRGMKGMMAGRGGMPFR